MSELLEPTRVRRWTTDEYLTVAAAGIFDQQRVELISGQILEVELISEPCAFGVSMLVRQFALFLPDKFRARCRCPLYLGDGNVPEPHIALVDAILSKTLQRPTTAHLAVEVVDSLVIYHRTEKASLYASAQIPEYWISNALNSTLEIYRAPIEDAEQAFGWKYSHKQELRGSDTASPLCAPDVVLTVGEFLP